MRSRSAALARPAEALVDGGRPVEKRTLLGFCGPSLHPRCFVFHQTERRIAADSLAQVRLPLYFSAVGRARRPLRASLDGDEEGSSS